MGGAEAAQVARNKNNNRNHKPSHEARETPTPGCATRKLATISVPLALAILPTSTIVSALV